MCKFQEMRGRDLSTTLEMTFGATLEMTGVIPCHVDRSGDILLGRKLSSFTDNTDMFLMLH